MDKQANRIGYMDAAKGLAIILMIMGHSQCPELLTKVIYSFHMPLFFAISGFFLSTSRSIPDIIKRRTQQILSPFIITASVLLCYRCLYAEFHHNFSLDTFCFYLIGILRGNANIASSVGAIWFLPALFTATIVARFAINHKRGYIFLIILAILALLSRRYFRCPMSIQGGLYCSIFVYMGYMMRKMNILESSYVKNRYIVLIAFIIWLSGAIYASKFTSLYKAPFYYVITTYLIAFIGIVLFILFLKQISSIRFLYIPLVYLGQSSLTILCFHCLEDSSVLLASINLHFSLLFLIKFSWAVGASALFIFLKNLFSEIYRHRCSP